MQTIKKTFALVIACALMFTTLFTCFAFADSTPEVKEANSHSYVIFANERSDSPHEAQTVYGYYWRYGEVTWSGDGYYGPSANYDETTVDNGGYDLYASYFPSERYNWPTIRLGLDFTIGQRITEKVRLSIRAFDTDEEQGELDVIYLVDETAGTEQKLGFLSGWDSRWNTTEFEIDPSYFEVGHTYHYKLNHEERDWVVWIRNVTMTVVEWDPYYLSAELDGSINRSGVVDLALTTGNIDETYNVEFKVTETATGYQRGYYSTSLTTTVDGETNEYSFPLESSSPEGIYKIDAIFTDPDTGVLERTVTIYRGFPFSAVSYNANGGTNNLPVDINRYTAGDTVTVLFDYIPSKTDYTFIGWAFDPDAEEPDFSYPLPEDADPYTFVIGEDDVTLYAIFTPDAHEHTWDEGEVIIPATCLEGLIRYTCTGCEETMDEVIPPNGEHDWDDGKITAPATCTTDGVKTYTCSRCGATREEPIPGEHVLVAVAYKAPNCIEDGNIAYYKCSVCGKCFTDAEGLNEIPEEDTILPATGEHDWDEGTVSVEPTCTANGLKVYICSVCGETKNEIIEKLPHDLHHVTNPATCAVEGVEYDVCTTCETIFNHVLTPKTDHTWDEGEVKSVGDCVTEGLKVFTCTVCGATREERTPVTGHSWGPWSFVKVPTYREGGSAERECKVCHEKETKEYGKVIPDITKKHDDTGVEIGFMKDTYGKDIDLKVTNTYDGSSYNFLNKEKGNFQFEIYDISTIEAGTETKLQPTGTVLVRLPIPADYSRDNLVIYYVTSTGTIEKMDMWIEGDFACFEAEHFSHYALVDESAEKVTFGDVDGDRQITSGDARLALRRSVKLENFEIGSLTFRACDVDFDGEVTSSDARSILRASVQLEKPEDWRK